MTSVLHLVSCIWTDRLNENLADCTHAQNEPSLAPLEDIAKPSTRLLLY